LGKGNSEHRKEGTANTGKREQRTQERGNSEQGKANSEQRKQETA
jgi:hypothetical protein